MKKLFLSIILSATILGGVSAHTVQADEAVSLNLAAYETYLNNMKTLTGDFKQTASNGTIHSGKLHLSRPGKMRLNYNPPSPLLVVADGEWLITYDKELDETNYVSLENTPAEFILRPHIEFGDDVKVLSVVPQNEDTLAITLAKADNMEEGQITLVFDTNPVSLREWTVIDGQGAQTQVVLSNLQLNTAVSDSLFKFNKPNLAEKLF